MSEFSPTLEQRRIERDFNRVHHPNLAIVARAGSGKTSTARYLTQSTHRRGCYLAYNTKNADEARAKFPPQVLVKTTHAIAFHALRVRKQWGHKLKDEHNKWPLWKIVREFSLEPYCGIEAAHIAHIAMIGLRRFMYSADNEIDGSHVYDPTRKWDYFERFLQTHYQERFQLEAPQTFIKECWISYQDRLLETAEVFWNAMLDPQHPFPIEHDAYLKLWQLKKPVIRGIDYLIIDESQDSNACVFDIVQRQPCQIVLIGDSAQHIYGFRGAKDVLGDLPNAQTLYLSQSFRFGQPIADVANAILMRVYPDLVPIIGNPLLNSRIGKVDPERYTLIARSNACLFESAVQLAYRRQSFHVVGSLRDPIARARSVYALSKGNSAQVRHQEIRLYEDWTMFQNEARYSQELMRDVKMVEKYSDELPGMCDLLERAGVVPEKRAAVILSTVHKSKGLEYPQVRLANDFNLKIEDGKVVGSQEEHHCLYVATTRAEQVLELNQVAKFVVDSI